MICVRDKHSQRTNNNCLNLLQTITPCSKHDSYYVKKLYVITKIHRACYYKNKALCFRARTGLDTDTRLTILHNQDPFMSKKYLYKYFRQKKITQLIQP